MGKYEVLGFLTVLRDSGDQRFLSYGQIHQEMKRMGLECSYVVVWRAVNGLFSDGFLDVKKEGDLLARRLSFRLKKPTVPQFSGMRRVNNTYQDVEQNRAAVLPGGRPEIRARGRTGVRHG